MSDAKKSVSGIRGVPGAVLSYFETLKPLIERFAKAWNLRSVPYENAKPGDDAWVWNLYSAAQGPSICLQICLTDAAASANLAVINVYAQPPGSADWAHLLHGSVSGPDAVRACMLSCLARFPWRPRTASA